ncbi:MAG: complex I NDUFA9 subunit family protein [Paracoccus sp. (in: a-proteobacteria)]|nr:complex I NDUFA9 subunit family protein [Paracoccus sp. (in: a-proteobacteria)]
MTKLVTIYGGSGFVGRQIARLMAGAGWRVRVAVRRPNEALFVRTYGAVGQVEAFPCNIRDDLSVAAAMADADAVINCVGILVNEGKNRFDAVQAEGAGRIARLASQRGIARLVHISAIGADAGSASNYARTKAEGEQRVSEEYPDAVILRPSVMFGPGDGLFERFAGMAGFGPILPMAGGDTRMQPVYVGDVARAAMIAAEGEVPPGIYELGGPQIMTTREIVDATLAETGRRRAVINLPFGLAGLAGGALDLVQFITGGLVTNRIVTRDQLRLLRSDNVVAPGAQGFEAFGITPTAPAAVIGSYLWRFRKGGQYAENLTSADQIRAD